MIDADELKPGFYWVSYCGSAALIVAEFSSDRLWLGIEDGPYGAIPGDIKVRSDRLIPPNEIADPVQFHLDAAAWEKAKAGVRAFWCEP